MKKINRSMFFSVLVVLAYVLSACSGAPAGQPGNDQSSQSGQIQEVVFTGTVDSMGGGQWTVSGQAINVDGATVVDANILVGDNVKVEARVGQDGNVTAVSIETSGADDTNSNSNDDNQNGSNANDNASNSNDNQNDNSNSNTNSGNDNGNGNDNSSADSEQEVSGVVEAITTDSITINGVTYLIADFTEFNDLIAMGDQVKVHVIVNADGTLTIREIERSSGTGIGNGNSNDNGSDDNSNSNDDNGNDDNGNDDNGNDDNGDDDSDDDNGNDDDSNSNGNG